MEHTEQDFDRPKLPPTRRNFIVWWLAALLTAIVAAITAPILVYLYPPKGPGDIKSPIKVPIPTTVDAI